MTEIYKAAEQFRAALLRKERAAATEMIRAYALVAARIERDAAQLRERMEAEGDRARVAWLYERERLETLLRQVRFEIRRLQHEVFNPLVVRAQREAVEAGLAEAAELMRLGLGEAGAFIDFNRLTPAAVEKIVGFTGAGSPLGRLLDELPGDAGARVKNSLLEAVALGWTPRRTARHVRAALGGNLARALTISRTETIRACREAAHQTYKANDDLIEKWVWTAALDGRPCLLCVLMHGTEHPVEERLESHPNCRCTAVPKTKSWAELGFAGIDDTRPQIASGEQWLAGQPEEDQQSILGPEAFKAYKAGQVKLADFVGRKKKSEWGRPYFRRSLSAALKAHDEPDTIAAMKKEKAKGKARGWFFAAKETFPYQPNGKLLGQGNESSCVAACVRMLLADEGSEQPEAFIRQALKAEDGAFLSALPETLKSFGSGRAFQYRRDLTEQELRAAASRGVVVAYVSPVGKDAGHALLLDGITDDGVLIRDPLPENQGTAYRVSLADFLEVWLNPQNNLGRAVFLVE